MSVIFSFADKHHSLSSGILILSGLIIFVTAEKFFTVIEQVAEEEKKTINTPENNNTKGLPQENNKKASMSRYLNIALSERN